MVCLKKIDHFLHVISIEPLHISEKARAHITRGKPHSNDILSYISHIQIKSTLLVSPLILGDNMACLNLQSLHCSHR
nr:hypothetical protein Iba_chr11dCG6360 [Ipomoea batatas]